MKKPRIIKFQANNFLRNSAFLLSVITCLIFSTQFASAAKIIRIGETKADDDIVKVEGKIGINTSNPYSLFEIASSTKYEGLRIISSASWTPFVIRNSANSADLFRIDQQGNITATGGVFGSNTDNYWKLNGSEIYSSSTAWNVGIGTTDPNVKLDVIGTGVFGSMTTSRGSYGNGLSLQNNNGATTSLFLWQNGAASGHLGFSASSNLLRIVNSTSDGLITNPASIVLTNTGRVGIGTTNPVSKLSIAAPDSTSTAAISLNGAGLYGSGFLAIWGNYGRLSQQSSGMNNISWGAYHDGSNWVRSYSGGVAGLVNLQIGNGNYFSIQTDSQSNPAVPSFTDVLTVKGTNVGIGNANPSSVPGLEVTSGTGYSIYAGSKKIGNVASPSATTDAANKDYVDSATAGFFAAPDLSLTQYNNYYYMQFGSITIPSGQIRYAGTWVVALYGYEVQSDYDKLGYLKVSIRRDASNNASYSASIANFGSKKVDPIYITSDDGVTYKLYIKVETKTSYSGYYKFKLIQQTQDPLILAAGTHITTDTAPSGTKYTWTATETSATFAGTNNYIPKFNSAGSLANSIIYDNGANVGVGTTNAAVKLTIKQADQEYAPLWTTPTGEIALGIAANTSAISGMDFKNFNSAGQVRLMARNNNNDYIAINAMGTTATASFFGQAGNQLLVFGVGKRLAIGTNGADPLIFGTSNTERARIDTSGNLGIGTTNPETRLSLQNSTYRQLSLKGGSGDQTLNLGSVESSVGSYIYNNAYYSTSNTYLPSKTSASGIQMRNDGSIDLLTDTGLTVGTTYTPTSRIKILSNGNVGFGTTNPSGKLEIIKNTATSWSNSETDWALRINDGTNDSALLLGVANALDAAAIQSMDPGTSWLTRPLLLNPNGANVGIGTTNPTDKLTVVGGGSFTSPVTVGTPTAVGHAATKAYVDTNFAPIGGSASLWATSSAGTYNVGLGNVGIGTTTPAAKLQVNASTGIEGIRVITSNFSPFVIRNSANSQDLFRVIQSGFVSAPSGIETSYLNTPSIYMSTSYGGGYFGNNGYFGSNELGIVEDSGGYNLITQSYDYDKLFIGNSITEDKGTGYVGIGTTNPNYRLEVQGGARFAAQYQNFGSIEIGGYYSPGSTYWTSKIVGDYYGNQYNANIAHGMSFIGGRDTFDNFRWFTSDLTELMTLKDNGNLGIGTTNPLDKLHVAGDVRINNLLNCSGTGSAVKTDASGRLICGTVSGGITGSGSSNYISKWTGASTQGNSVIYDNGTNVGIGKTDPSQKLDVNGVITAVTGFRINNGATSGQYLRGNGSNFVSSSIQASDVPTLNQSTTGSAYYLTSRDTRTVNDIPSDFNSFVKFDFKQNSTNGLSDGGTYNGVMTWRKYGTATDLSGGPSMQLAYTDNGHLWTRLSSSASSWGTWRRVISENASGNVGIGTTNPSHKLQVNGNALLESGNYLYFRDTGSYINESGGLNVIAGSSRSLNLVGGSGTTGITVAANGRVGINNNSPSGLLDVVSHTATDYPAVSIHSNQTAGIANLLVKTAHTPNSDRYLIQAKTTGSGDITQFFARQDGVGYFNSSLGIGTTNPGAKLHIATAGSGVRSATLVTSSEEPFKLSTWQGTTGVDVITAELLLSYNETKNTGIQFYRGGSTTGGFLTFTTNNNTEQMRITAAGNVGIGTTSPGYKLDVAGDVGAASFTYNSDVRLKKNIKTIKNPLDKILSLRGVTFNWKESGDASVGLIAQEVEKVFPELVNGKDIKGVEYGNLVAPLIEAVKEQQRIIDNLEARINILEKKAGKK